MLEAHLLSASYDALFEIPDLRRSLSEQVFTSFVLLVFKFFCVFFAFKWHCSLYVCRAAVHEQT